MGFISWLKGGNTSNITSNGVVAPPGTVGPDDWAPGDPDGIEFSSDEVEGRALPSIFAAPWSGWPAGWETPGWHPGIQSLADTAWACLDLNASVLSSMPVYKTRDGQVAEPEPWMSNPDPRIYSSWQEFAKQLFWDYQMGEAFVLATDYFSTGYPMFMRVLPPWSVTVDGPPGNRIYKVGTVNITGDVLHIRYRSTLDGVRGQGPLDAAGCRLTAASVLARYMADMVSAPPPYMTLSTDQLLNAADATRIMEQYIESRTTYRGYPAVLDGGFKLETNQMNAKDMALLELAQFNESRIATLLGVPPFLVGLPSGGDSMTYSNVSSLFDFHDRASLRPKATAVMSALSNWALGPGRAVELDRDDYSRPALPEFATALKTLHEVDAITSGEIRDINRNLLSTGNRTSSTEVAASSSTSESRTLSVAEVVQKVYLGVANGVITRDEARQIINDAGGKLAVGG